MVDERYNVPVGIYYVSGIAGSERDSLIANTVFVSAGCAVSYDNIRKALGVPPFSSHAQTAFCGVVEALLDKGVPVVLSDREVTVTMYSEWLSQVPIDLMNRPKE